MKPITKHSVLFFSAVFAGILLVAACESRKESKENIKHQSINEAHVYTCPMHPEVKSDEPGKCPKCGMALEHTKEDAHAHAEKGKEFEMNFRSEPAAIESGKPAKLFFRPEEAGKSGTVVQLDNVHEMKIHLLIVSKDLSYFAHVHPKFTSEGSYVWEHIFPEGGEYVLFQDYTPTGSDHQLGRQDIRVSGKEAPLKKLGDENLSWEKDGYKVRLTSDKPFSVNTPAEIKASIFKNGKPVKDLKNYLGELAHVVIVSEDTEEYLHVHSMKSATKGPDIMLHTDFPKKGKYRVFMQFNHDNKIHTSSFTVNAI